MSEYIPIKSIEKTIDDYWKELEDIEFAIFVAKQSNNEDKLSRLERKRNILIMKIKNMQGESNE